MHDMLLKYIHTQRVIIITMTSDIINDEFSDINNTKRHILNDSYNGTDKLFAIFQKRKSIQHEIFTIVKSFSETNNHVKVIEKYFVVFTE